MNGFTVNIADFRCRGVARATFALHRLTRGLHGPGNPSPDADWQNEPDAPAWVTKMSGDIRRAKLKR